MSRLPLFALLVVLTPLAALGQEAPTIAITSPGDQAHVRLGDDPQKSVTLQLAVTGFTVRPHGQCGTLANCGHVHVAIDPDGTTCNYPGKPGNNTNAGTGGNEIKALFALCPVPTGPHVLGVALAHDDHSPVLVDGKPVTAVIHVTAE